MKKLVMLIITLAVVCFTGCAKEELSDWQISYNEGIKYMEDGNHQQAVEAFEKAVKLEPENFEAHMALYKVYSDQGNAEKAEEIMNTVKKSVGLEEVKEKDKDVKSVTLDPIGAVRTERMDRIDKDFTAGEYYIFEFDENDRCIRTTLYRENDTVEKVILYYENGKIKDITEYNSDGEIKDGEMYTLDEQGRYARIEHKGVDAEGTFTTFEYSEDNTKVLGYMHLGWKISEIYDLELNENGYCTVYENTDHIMESGHIVKYEYNEDGLCVQSRQGTDEILYEEYTHDENGRISGGTYWQNGEADYKFVLEYSPNGDVLDKLNSKDDFASLHSHSDDNLFENAAFCSII